MRISSNLFFQTGLNAINAQQSDLVHLYRQVGSGKRMVAPSDDPLAAAQAINVSQTLAMGERYAANRKVASQNLGMQDNVLNSVTLQLQDVKTRLVQAGNGTLSDVDRAMLAEVLQGARDSLLNLANSTDGNGQYLFSGSKGNSAAFSESGVYVGDNNSRLVQVDQTRELPTNALGIDVFSRAAPGTVGYVTRPGSANTGMGAISGYNITNTEGLAAGRLVKIEFVGSTANPGTLAYKVTVPTESGTELTYESDLPAGGASPTLLDAELGLEVILTGTPQIGDTFEMVPMHSSNYSVGPQGAAAGGAIVRSVSNYGGEAIRLTFDGSDWDPVNWKFVGPNNDPVGSDEYAVTEVPGHTPPRYSVDVDGVQVVFDRLPDNGSQFTVSAGPGSQSRGELNMFTALDDVIAALRNTGGTDADSINLQNALNSALQRIEVTYNNVLSVQASGGTRLNEIDALNANGNARVLEYKHQLSQLEDLDYYTAITQLTLRTTALEAAAMAFQKIQNTSLFTMNARG